mgnify:CR=1 FL=1
MPKILMEAQISKPFDTWAEVFDADKDDQEANGFKVMYRGHKLDDPNTVVILMEGDPSKLEPYMSQPEKAKVIEKSGHIAESTAVTVLSD